MNTICTILLIYNITIHFWFMVFEIFFWRSSLARKSFGMSEQLANDSALLASNQGLYNGLLASGLLWGVLTSKAEVGISFQMYFVGAMGVAGIYGGITAKKWFIFGIQGVPAIINLILLFNLK